LVGVAVKRAKAPLGSRFLPLDWENWVYRKEVANEE
jgi:hypothetical protein